ncbi:MAG: bifunctional (p)ppGpp synthetase/guanosine-3',5'-bis(diphosphate) 3'-pyrophosphohydrolase [Clostridiaceae bacterium]|nr:bifunctional (p)ppGpp synthetase/guanosine-3',5'-bis(diphosphate) 3'-pyrophosphohydrolase [Clostridiaceae bacterium]
MITKAIIFAAKSHDGAIRKGTEAEPIPYIVHPMEAAAIAATMTNDPNVIAAALLHDVVEDTDVSIETIKSDFNEVIAELVAGESENKRSEQPAEETWKIRKQETLEFLKQAEENSKIVALSDKLSNIRAIKRDYMEIGDRLWDRFNQKDIKMHAWYYRSVKEALNELHNYEAWKEYSILVEEVFGDK